MKPNTLKEGFSSGFSYDTILTRCQNGHIRELIEHHKHTIIAILIGWKLDVKSMDIDSQGLFGVGRGVYKPYFLMVGLTMIPTIHNLI